MNSAPRLLMALGIMLFGVGLMWHFGGKWLRLGRLPGDIVIEKPGMKFYFPVATSILISLMLSAIAMLWSRWGPKQ